MNEAHTNLHDNRLTTEENKVIILEGLCPATRCACPDDCPILPERGKARYCRDYYQTVHPMPQEMRDKYEAAE